MKRKFECWHCHKTFEADDTTWVECPHCQSDNVEYASWHAPRWIGKVLISLTLSGLVVGFGLSMWHDTPKDQEESYVNNDEALEAFGDSLMQTEEKFDYPPVLTLLDTPKFTEEGYSCYIKVTYPPQGEYKIVICKAFSSEVVATSDDGHFEGVPYSEDDGGSYRVTLQRANGDSICAYTPIIGFIKQVKPKTRMTKEQIQSLLDKQDVSLMGVGESDYIAPDLKISFKGLPSDAMNIPQNFAEAFDKINMGVWDKIRVITLEYDDMNRISKITLQVTLSQNDF